MNTQQSTYDPYWTDVVYSLGGVRDALGIETLSENILADLLPGINNQTRRARYYSFWAWVLHDFIHDPDAIHTQNGFYKWSRRREDTLILAQIAHGCTGAAAGTTQGLHFWQGGEPAIYPVDWKSLMSVDGGSYQLYYRGALSEMNIIAVNTESLHDKLLEPIGVRLAEAYASAVQPTHYVGTSLDATAVTKPIIEEFAQYGCLCQVANVETERKALIDAFFRFNTPDSYAIKRLASLSFFLDLIQQSRGLPLDDRQMRAVIYFWGFGDSHDYLPVGNLIEPAQRWRIFQLRQYYVFANDPVYMSDIPTKYLIELYMIITTVLRELWRHSMLPSEIFIEHSLTLFSTFWGRSAEQGAWQTLQLLSNDGGLAQEEQRLKLGAQTWLHAYSVADLLNNQSENQELGVSTNHPI